MSHSLGITMSSYLFRSQCNKDYYIFKPYLGTDGVYKIILQQKLTHFIDTMTSKCNKWLHGKFLQTILTCVVGLSLINILYCESEMLRGVLRRTFMPLVLIGRLFDRKYSTVPSLVTVTDTFCSVLFPQ